MHSYAGHQPRDHAGPREVGGAASHAQLLQQSQIGVLAGLQGRIGGFPAGEELRPGQSKEEEAK